MLHKQRGIAFSFNTAPIALGRVKISAPEGHIRYDLFLI